MNRFRLLALSGLVCSAAIAGLAVLAILTNPFGGDTTEGGGNAARAAQQDSADSTSDPSGVGEGIQVHGDWVIEVRDPDGSLAERREFKNALIRPNFLAQVLARHYYVGTWGVILLNGDAPTPQPCLYNGDPSGCLMEEASPGGIATWPTAHFPTLTVDTDTPGCCDGSTFVLQGNFDAQADGVISRVETIYCHTLPANPDPTTCNNSQSFTGTSITPVDVLAGQQVLVTVRISFS